jgi:peptidyl-Lys metalloendopeptidase
MKRFFRWIAIVTMAFAAIGVSAAPQDGIDVRLSVPNPVVRGDVDVMVTVVVTNLTRHPVNLLRWQLPTEELEGALFRIERDGERVAYTGPLIKRPGPGPADRVQLDPGASLSYQVELTGAYDLSRNGLYTIEYLSRGAHGQYKAALKSEKLYLWLEGRSAKAKPVPPPPPTPGGSISFSGNCTASQQTTLQSAAAQATTYSDDSMKYLATVPPKTERYPEWFGTYSAEHGATAHDHFVKLSDAFTNKPVTLDCKCKKPYYAYVYPSQPYKIYVCSVFWRAPLKGTDSQAGTLIHEMSHFTVVAGTDDWAYGQTAARALAASDPVKALDNADSHEYFSENTPQLQ